MKYKLALIFVFLINFCCFSQQEELDDGSTIEIFNSANAVNKVLSSINSNQLNTNNIQQLSNQQNAILIQQIGDYNRVYSQTQSSLSNLELFQYGNSNEIDLIINAPSIKGSVLQNGNNNSVIDNIYYSNQDIQLNIIQNGNNLSVNRIGVNSLTNKLQLVQQGSFKNITIISK